jgi:hypothetical protein
MNDTKTRRLIWRIKRNIGHLLTEIRLIPVSSIVPEDVARLSQSKDLLGANQSQLHDLYKRYPQYAPIKVRQMKLDL